MLHSDRLSHHQATSYSPLVAKSAGLENKTMAVESRFAEVSDRYYIFLTYWLDFTKTINL